MTADYKVFGHLIDYKVYSNINQSLPSFSDCRLSCACEKLASRHKLSVVPVGNKVCPCVDFYNGGESASWTAKDEVYILGGMEVNTFAESFFFFFICFFFSANGLYYQ